MNDIQIVNQHTDEVDIVQLMKTLWLGKKIIIGCTITFTFIAIGYVLLAQQWWTSSAVVTMGQYKNIAPLRQQVANFYVVSNNQNINKDKEQNNITGLDSIFNEQKMLDQYIIEFNAFDNKQSFILKNPIMKEYANVINGKNNINFIEGWAKKIQAKIINNKEKNIYILSFQATTPELSHKLLLAYTQFIDKKIQREVFFGLNSIIKDKTLELKAEYLSLQLQAKQLKQQELIKTDYALKIANSAKANKPMPQMNTDQIFSIDLGSEGLTEKSKILKQITDLSVFEPALIMVKTNLELLSKIKLDNNINLETVRYLQNIDYPISRDKPKRALIVILGSLLGCMLGVAIVLLIEAINKK